MCGLVGIVNADGRPVDERVLASMAESIRHRGPDDEGALVENGVGLAHRRLSIIDLEGGRQPMTKQGCTVVFNGEIYNYLELRDELRRNGHEFETASDTEVLLTTYLEHGPDCVEHLNGMFALLILDRHRRRLVATRDHFGIKPLYFCRTAEGLLYASEIKALLRHPAVTAERDDDALHDYVTFQHVLGAATLFRGIRRVLPGQIQTVDLDTLDVSSRRYWEPSFAVDADHTEAYFEHRLRELIEDSVRLQLRSDVPLGTHLSGGFDSSVVTALAARHTPEPVQSFTGAFREGPEFDETPFAREASAFCGTELHEIYPTPEQFEESLPRLAYHMDEPAAGPGLFPQYAVSRLAAGRVKVVLGGQGGDEIFGGYARYVVAYLEQALKGTIFETNEEGEHIVSLTSILPNLPYLKRYVPMMRHFWAGGAFEDMDRRYFRLIDRSGGDLGGFSREFAAAFDRDAVFERFRGTFHHPETRSYYNKMVAFDLVASLPALLHVEDRVSMAVSLESRVPLLDRRVVDLVCSMPPATKFRGASMKYIFKKACRDLLPARIVERKDKMGFPVPLHLWARNGLRDFFLDVLLSRACRERGLFDHARIEELLDTEEAFGRRLWGLLNLELWHRAFFDGAMASPNRQDSHDAAT